jgi:hypothetical protein
MNPQVESMSEISILGGNITVSTNMKNKKQKTKTKNGKEKYILDLNKR